MTGSPLGRYAAAADGAPVHAVQLLGVPVRLMVEGRDRHDALLRELALLALTDDDAPARTPRLLALVEQLGARYGAAAPRPDDVVDEAAAQGRAVVDLSFEVPASVVQDADRVERLLDEADELCRSEELLALPRTPLQVRFAHWYVDELRRQVAGEPPRAWDGPLEG